MQIFVGACIFVAAVLLLAYVPGKLLLLLVKLTLEPLEDVTLSCFLGLVVSGVVYWLVAFADQARFYFVWPLATATVFVWCQRSKIKLSWPHCVRLAARYKAATEKLSDRSSLVLAGVVAFGIIVLASLPFYYTNFTWRGDGMMRVCPVPDVLLHIALANELTHTVRHQAHVSGHLLSYHYGMDVAVAMFAKATRLNAVT